MDQKLKEWYDDWELTAGGSQPDLENAIEFVNVLLPNAHFPVPMLMRFHCETPEENRVLGVLLDALLCQLTGTQPGTRDVKELGNGATEPT